MEPDVTDEYLVRRAQAGYLDAFEQLVLRHRHRAYRVALRLLAQPADAEDVAQDSLVQAWHSLPGFRAEASFASWLYRIVVNKSRDAARRTRPLPVDLSVGDPPPAAGLAPDAAQVVETTQRAAALHTAIAALPFELRAPLVLRELEQCSYAEIAHVLGLSEPTVRGRLARARAVLLQRMRGWS